MKIDRAIKSIYTDIQEIFADYYVLSKKAA